jgi:hypothetical protein
MSAIAPASFNKSPMLTENIPEAAIDYQNWLTCYAADWQERIRGERRGPEWL